MDSNPLLADNVALGDAAPSKLTEIRRMLKHDKVIGLGKEYPLFNRLLHSTDASSTGSHANIAGYVGTDGRTLKRWAESLEVAGLITITALPHKQYKLQLAEPFYSVAIMEESAPATEPFTISSDPELQNIITIYETAKATGQEIEITAVKRVSYG